MWNCQRCGAAEHDDVESCRSCGGHHPTVGVDLADGAEVGAEKADGSGSDKKLACPRCSGAMEGGYLSPQLVGKPFKQTNVMPVSWHKGVVKWSMWLGYRSRSKGLPLRAFRCERCGYVEFYCDPAS